MRLTITFELLCDMSGINRNIRRMDRYIFHMDLSMYLRREGGEGKGAEGGTNI